ncbi:glycerophosphodiester phosphodiesterase [Leifsonia sp. LS-T14]|uniref:glycerophosphodiester phosphodiesterase n=1 Tax=unclassified Leifsonia TaxID=2663824 RepID=UPI0035A64B1F
MSDDEEDAPPARPGITRRALIGGALGGAAVVVAASVAGAELLPRLLGSSEGLRPATPTPTRTLTRENGLLVERLVQRPGFTVAHRGGSLDWPEMSLEAYRNSVALGVNALEISLARTSDGVWFGLHDDTLDRTSGTAGFVAAQHTWKEVERFRITAAETNDPSQPAQPYLRFEELVAAYGRTHTIFVDPKVVPVAHLGELFALMSALKHPTGTFVAKGYCTAQAWPVDAHARGYTTWGYYYGSEIGADPTLVPTTQERWTWLGLDVGATVEQWQAFTATGKPVVAHIVRSRAAADQATSRGANGLVVSGVREVLA